MSVEENIRGMITNLHKEAEKLRGELDDSRYGDNIIMQARLEDEIDDKVRLITRLEGALV